MQFLSLSEFEQKLGYTTQSLVNRRLFYTNNFKMRTESDVGKLTNLAGRIARAMSALGTTTLIIGETSVFPSSQNPVLAEVVRKAFGASASVHDTPIQIFSPDEGEGLWCIMSICLYNFWDFFLIDGDASIVIENSHDEWLSVYSKTVDGHCKLREAITPLELKDISPTNWP